MALDLRLASVRKLQSQTQEELDALLPSVLRPHEVPECNEWEGGAFKGEL
jgi:hypothetical protein